MPSTSTPIRVSVHFHESSVFAGEDIRCTITFKNVTPSQSPAERSPSRTGDPKYLHPERQRPKPLAARAPSVTHSVAPSVAPTIPSSVQLAASRNSSFHDATLQGVAHGASAAATPDRPRGHRPTLSLNTPRMPDVRSPSALSTNFNGSASSTPNHNHKHARSLSIMSMGRETVGKANNGNAPQKRPPRGHGRSASLQVMPGRGGGGFGSPNGTRTLQPSPFLASYPPAFARSQTDFAVPLRPGRRTSRQSTPTTGGDRKASLGSFKFPAGSPERSPGLGEMSPALEISPADDHSIVPRTRAPSLVPSLGGSLTRSPDETVVSRDKLAPSPVTRILSGSSMNGGSTRSSGEFYAISNNSTDTLASEYVSRPSARLLSKPTFDRRSSNLAPHSSRQQKQPEVLMMGYAQVMGSFSLDGSLVNQAPFEEVKRKGVVGGQGGGGVVGIERTKSESGLFGALGWSNIGESLGGLLGGGEPSSIREMRAVASLKTVPLLSTPQSILFVDLKLAPGESRSYTYSFTIPRGLPPTHKGRAMKVNYHLSIGTQRPGTAAQAVRNVTVPFRVFGSVTSRGEILGHDLMSPYIILRDQAIVAAAATPKPIARSNGSISRKATEHGKEAAAEFEHYVRNLLDTTRQTGSSGLLSPTAAPKEFRRRSTLDENPVNSMKEAIDFAILRSNISTSSNQSTNSYEIARNGRRVAVIKLARPSYRLGETISAVIDFGKADIPVFGIAVTLETSEKIDPVIAMRSGASIYRVTRKVHASFAENTLFARRVSFGPTIPPNATPEFVTSGINLEWKLRVEFVTPRVGAEEGMMQGQWGGLLEDVSNDERGIMLAAVERLNVESFEVAVPIRVYGTTMGSDSLATEEEGYVI